MLRAVGTAVGLVFATALSEWLAGDGVALALALTISAGFAYGMLTVQYALFTTAVTSFAVLLADTLGDPALLGRAAGNRDAVGIAITLVVFLLWPSPEGVDSGWGRFVSWAHRVRLR